MLQKSRLPRSTLLFKSPPSFFQSKLTFHTAQWGNFTLPAIKNEPMLNYEPLSKERSNLINAIETLRLNMKTNDPINQSQFPNQDPSLIKHQYIPYEHQTSLCSYYNTTEEQLGSAIKIALDVKKDWENMPFNDRAAIFLKAADLLSSKYRYEMVAATMLGQGKNVWQAEIDSAAELADFWRFNVAFAQSIYSQQPTENSQFTWNRMEYRPLEGFIAAFSPFNFTAIGGNLSCAPALMGNVVLWKPSHTSIYSNYIVMKILKGLPDGVIQFIPGDPELVSKVLINHPSFAGLHFTGSTKIFNHLWSQITSNLDKYKSYPRIVGETGGKNMHMIHESADVVNVVMQTIRGAFEYSGQKCSACSRVYCPDTLFPAFKTLLLNSIKEIKVGSPENFSTFMSAVINKPSFDKITGYINRIKDIKGQEIIAGGGYDDSIGYYIEPTVILTDDPKSLTMTDELFGPVVTVYVYPSHKYNETLELANETTQYGLTAALFATDRSAIIQGVSKLSHAAGNLYINDKCTGAVVGQQPFGGGRGSGTNDKAGSTINLLRWVSPRVIKESFVPITHFKYPSNKTE